ncbi:MAG: 30S ribosomal protein S17 [Patescibacteria group bacterium]|jgi:small subunit ribosomal protein S17
MVNNKIQEINEKVQTSGKILKGTVVSTKMDKTIIVSVETKKVHPLYKKQYRSTKRFFAHNEDETIQAGDKVTIRESKPISKNKRWIVVKG